MTLGKPLPLSALRETFGNALEENVMLGTQTTARIGGAVEALLIAKGHEELAAMAGFLWDHGIPFRVLGNGSNVLVSDEGYQGVVILNRARKIEVDETGNPPSIWAESGAILGTVARQAASLGLSGLEWATSVPGSVGGAVYGNAGAHGSDTKSTLIVAEILHQMTGREEWDTDRLQFGYRTSVLKQGIVSAVILWARFALSPSTPEQVKTRMEEFGVQRRASQPTGASMGSMFKNPPGDFAGRLIESAGLKGKRIGGAEISTKHANFFINTGDAKASDIFALIRHCQKVVREETGINLELEIELLGNWPEDRITELRSNH